MPKPLTDPMKHGSYSLTSRDGEDSIYFDYALTPEGVTIHSVIDCNSAHFIEDFVKVTVPKAQALAEAQAQIDGAHQWFFDNEHWRYSGKRSLARFVRDLKVDLARPEPEPLAGAFYGFRA